MEAPMLHPDETFEVDLDEGTDVPDTDHRRLVFAYGTAGDWIRYEKELDRLYGIDDIQVTGHFASLVDSQLDTPQGAEELADRMALDELIGLARQLPLLAQLSAAQKKKSKSSSPLKKESSAATATSETAGA
jgi:hypothetical protein